ncbi:uncharacterized protein LOC116175926 [Photinus pyralis]|uniref:Uncharacterized protein n=1 Tax=Photinus pyralis TaxID=7054 RepID=A0A1Y1KZL2_PHOPY|nr:uncharacterized protein LOC116175926 [Photinus pyralis]
MTADFRAYYYSEYHNQISMAHEFSFDLNELNSSTLCKPFISVKDLIAGDKHKVLKMDYISTKYEERVMVETESFKCVLPERYYKFFQSDYRMAKFNDQLKTTDIHLSSLGSAGKTTNLQFV